MTTDSSKNYISQLEEENAALKMKLEEREHIDKFDEVQMRKLWVMVIEKTMDNRDGYIIDKLPDVANLIVDSYEKRFIKNERS